MNKEKICEILLSLFAGRHDVFALGKPHRLKPGRLEYFPQREPLTCSHVLAHLQGKVRLGIYPLVDGQVHWFAVDFDGDKELEPDAAWEATFPAATAQAAAFAQHGLITYIERSQSGRGAHLWGFLSRPFIAAEVRRTILPMLLPSVNLDLVYPVQAKPDDLGNLLAMPFYGEAAKSGYSVFVDADGAPMKMATWLEGVAVNDADLFASLVETAVAAAPVSGTLAVSGVQRQNVPLVSGFLKLISPYGCSFMRHCATNAVGLGEPMWRAAISQCSALKQGRDAAHVLSAPDPRYVPDETDYKFDRVSQKPVYTCQYIRETWPELACKTCPGHRPVDRAQGDLLEITKSEATPMGRPKWGQGVSRVFARDAGEMDTGVKWGLPGFDKYTRLRAGELIVIGANPSVGKTAFAVDRSKALAEVGTPAFFFSCESGEVSIMDRYLANEADIDSRRLRGEIGPRLTTEELARVEEAAAYLATLPLFLSFASSSPDRVYEQTEEVALRERLPLFKRFVSFYDYLQLSTTGIRVGGAGNSPYEATSLLSAQFKALAKVTQNPFVLFSQLIRKSEGQTAEEASLNQFKESGRIEADVDEAFQLGGERDTGPVGTRWCRNLKGREGDSNYVVPLTFYKAVSRFAGPDDAPVPDGIGLESLPVSGPEGDRVV